MTCFSSWGSVPLCSSLPAGAQVGCFQLLRFPSGGGRVTSGWFPQASSAKIKIYWKWPLRAQGELSITQWCDTRTALKPRGLPGSLRGSTPWLALDSLCFQLFFLSPAETLLKMFNLLNQKQFALFIPKLQFQRLRWSCEIKQSILLP